MKRRFSLGAFLISAILASNTICARAQTMPSGLYAGPELEIGFSIVWPQLNSGIALLQSKELRSQELSYYQAPNGSRKKVGKYSTQVGYAIDLSYYKPVTKVKGLLVGTEVHAAMTGSTPQNGGYSEGYYFNYLAAGVAVKYYPLKKMPLFLTGELGFGAVLTKNRFVSEQSQQDFFHQFGVGVEGGIGLGYTFSPFRNKRIGLSIRSAYQFYSTRVEVNNVGDDTWKFGSWGVGTTVSF